MRRLLAAVAFGSWLVAPAKPAAEVLLAPLARAFGAPRETELVKCREAFAQLQTRLGESRVLVQPVLFVDGPRRQWRIKLAHAIVDESRRQTTAKLEVAPGAAPAVAPAQFRNNQLRYTWERAAQYAECVKALASAADYVWFAEIWGHDGKVGAIQIYVFNAKGQIAYCRQLNSHQFGSELPLEGPAAVQRIVRQFFDDLPREPKRIYPPHGVG